MRPSPFNSFQPQGHHHRPQQQQQHNNGYSNNHHQQRNGYQQQQNQVNSNQFGMLNPQMMMNNHIPIPNNNMPMHPQFFNNMPQQQHQQFNQFGVPNNINHLLQFAVATHMVPSAQPNFFPPPPPPPQLHHSFTFPHQNHLLHPRPQGNKNGSNSTGNDFRNKHDQFNGPAHQGFQRSQMHQPNHAKQKPAFNKDKGYDQMATRIDAADIDKANKRKKGRPNKKRRRHVDQETSQESCVITRIPTLLEKLLSSDIKREKSQLLQVLRFVVMNSFFKEFPKQPLKLPLVMVEETGCEHDREDDPINEILNGAVDLTSSDDDEAV